MGSGSDGASVRMPTLIVGTAAGTARKQDSRPQSVPRAGPPACGACGVFAAELGSCVSAAGVAAGCAVGVVGAGAGGVEDRSWSTGAGPEREGWQAEVL